MGSPEIIRKLSSSKNSVKESISGNTSDVNNLKLSSFGDKVRESQPSGMLTQSSPGKTDSNSTAKSSDISPNYNIGPMNEIGGIASTKAGSVDDLTDVSKMVGFCVLHGENLNESFVKGKSNGVPSFSVHHRQAHGSEGASGAIANNQSQHHQVPALSDAQTALVLTNLSSMSNMGDGLGGMTTIGLAQSQILQPWVLYQQQHQHNPYISPTTLRKNDNISVIPGAVRASQTALDAMAKNNQSMLAEIGPDNANAVNLSRELKKRYRTASMTIAYSDQPADNLVRCNVSSVSPRLKNIEIQKRRRRNSLSSSLGSRTDEFVVLNGSRNPLSGANSSGSATAAPVTVHNAASLDDRQSMNTSTAHQYILALSGRTPTMQQNAAPAAAVSMDSHHVQGTWPDAGYTFEMSPIFSRKNNRDSSKASISETKATCSSSPNAGINRKPKGNTVVKKEESIAAAVAPLTLEDFPVGLKCEVLDEGEWTAARVRRRDGELLLVHFEGHGCEIDDWVGLQRIRVRLRGTSKFGPSGPESESRWSYLRRQAQKSGAMSTALGFDSGMLGHRCTCARPSSGHPEQPNRIIQIMRCMDADGLIDRAFWLKARQATRKELEYVHTAKHVRNYGFPSASPDEIIEAALLYSKNRAENGSSCDDADGLDDSVITDKGGSSNICSIEPEIMECGGVGVSTDTVFNPEFSPVAARLAAGCVLEVMRLVVTGKMKNGFAVVRPPGHHAEDSHAMGFCFFNNVSVAATVARQQYNVKKVLIIDWDVHHGNGTQNMFYDDPNVLYISIHRYDDGNYHPYSGAADEVGGRNAKGFNVNVPWNGGSTMSPMGNTEYVAAFEYVIMPIARAFNPDLVLVSAGFDAAEGDSLGGYKVTPEGFAYMTNVLLTLADGKLVLALEGGYDLLSLSTSAAACMRVLLDKKAPLLPISSRYGHNQPLSFVPYSHATEALKSVQCIQQEYWPTLTILESFRVDSSLFEDARSSNRRRTASPPWRYREK